MPQPT